jgi:hypothetical protein
MGLNKMGILKNASADLLRNMTGWIYPSCEYCKVKIVEWNGVKNYKGKVYHHRCLIKHKRRVYK